MRWALIVEGLVANVVEQDEMPTVPGVWVPAGNSGPGWQYVGGEVQPPPAPAVAIAHRLTKRSFWNRFPAAKERAMRAVMIAGSPILLAADLRRLTARVEDSPFVDLDLQETKDGVMWLGSPLVPETVTIDGEIMPFRLTGTEVSTILSLTLKDTEVYR